jgi:hypothetical protein
VLRSGRLPLPNLSKNSKELKLFSICPGSIIYTSLSIDPEYRFFLYLYCPTHLIMARTKQTARKTKKGIITWTRFHLPEEQEWPIWSQDYANVYVGPLSGVQGRWRFVFLGRMVDHPTQAAYILGKCCLPISVLSNMLTRRRMGYAGRRKSISVLSCLRRVSTEPP